MRHFCHIPIKWPGRLLHMGSSDFNSLEAFIARTDDWFDLSSLQGGGGHAPSLAEHCLQRGGGQAIWGQDLVRPASRGLVVVAT